MADDDRAAPTLAEMQHWTGVIGAAQQRLLEYATAQMAGGDGAGPGHDSEGAGDAGGTAAMVRAQADFWAEGIALWQHFADPSRSPAASPLADAADRDRRFAAPQWRDNPAFDLVRQSYLLVARHMMKGLDTLPGMSPEQAAQLRFAARAALDAAAPSNFPLTNPEVIERTLETGGQNLLTGIERLLTDLAGGQLTHVDPDAYEVGRNLAMTPGKVVKQTPLYQLIQYAPATPRVAATPLVIFPAWINRYYILDLAPEKSFVRWAVAQGLTVFVVSWRSADATMAGVTMDDYVLRGQIDAIDTVRGLLGVERVHTIGYCVAGTALAAMLALLAARGEADKVASATFLTAQVDFEEAGELRHFISDEQLAIADAFGGEGLLDGRYMAATFNLLRGREMIWNTVVNNYLLGEDYAAFDLLHWNSDTTNLPAAWHGAYLRDFYRDNRLAKGGYELDGTRLDLALVATPAYAQAGRDDHIAPAASVWKLTHHFTGPLRFVLAGSGHIAGVVNPPSAGKYQYWTNDDRDARTLDEFVTGAVETRGSWWPDWRGWLAGLDDQEVAAEGARIPGAGALLALEDAPGSYVRLR